jgi:hypothetical protein
MSCGCCTPNITIAPTICCTPTTEPPLVYTAENVNAIGIGVLNGTTGTNFEFRGIASDTLALTVTLDEPNNAIIISFNDELLIDDIPTATETIRGIAEVATQGETNAGALDDKIVTPLKLFSMLATETQRGILEIATQAEVTTGTNDTNAVTPLKLTTFAGTQKVTRTFADAVARAAAVPNFHGQLGIQLDTNALIMSTGTIAGTFTPNIGIGGNLTVTGDISAVGSSITVASISTTQFSSAEFSITGGSIFSGAPFSFETGTTFQINGTPATDSVLVGRTLGAADAKPISEFLSTDNVQTGWGTPSGTLARTTFASYAGQTISNPPTQAEVQALDDAVVIVSRRLAALITDILAVNLPSA